MATKLYYDGKIGKIPDIYTAMKSGIVNPPLALDYGVVLIIDTGSMAGYGSGSGVLGTNKSGVSSIVRGIDTPQLMLDFVKGGLWHGLTEPLFRPYKTLKGVSEIMIARAATTTAGTMSYTFTGGGANGGTIAFETIDEGVAVNGDDTVGHLSKGFGALMQAAPNSAGKFIIKLFLGTFTGLNHLGRPYDGVAEVDAMPKLLAVSPEFDNLNDFKLWVDNSKELAKVFSVTVTPAGTGVVDAADLAANNTLKKIAGGTEVYSQAALDAVHESIAEMKYNFIFMDKSGADAAGAMNLSTLYHMKNDSKFGRIAFVAAYNSEADFDLSRAVCDTYDDEDVVVVHGGSLKTNTKVSTGFDSLPAIYTAARALGRTAGLPPQVPLTFKLIGVDGLEHQPKKGQKEDALDDGLMILYKDEEFGGFAVLQDVNSLQKNDFLVNEDATSHSVQFVRIKHQINYEIYVNAKKTLFGNPQGTNRNTLSEADVKTFIKKYLSSKLATKEEDNLILAFQNITVERDGDIYKAKYEFKPNTEITKMLITGVIID